MKIDMADVIFTEKAVARHSSVHDESAQLPHLLALTRSATLCRVSSMGNTELRITNQTLKVLGILTTSSVAVSGAEIAVVTKLASGTLYPILLRLENAQWVESHWETKDPRDLGRPRRRLYQITALGQRKAIAALRELSSAFGELAWQ
jgi:DNA-binding MarR family transcriptional regulator